MIVRGFGGASGVPADRVAPPPDTFCPLHKKRGQRQLALENQLCGARVCGPMWRSSSHTGNWTAVSNHYTVPNFN